MHSRALSSIRNPYLRANSLSELLLWHDVDFVRCAYVTILGRQPDPEGEAHFTDRIRGGESKMKILWDLRRSYEGAGHDPGISGLDRELKIAALRRRRLIGWLARLLYAGEGTSRLDQSLRQVQNTLDLIRDEQNRQSLSLATAIEQGGSIKSRVELLTRKGGPPEWRDQIISSETTSDHLTSIVNADLSSRERLALSIIRKKRAK